MTLSLCMIVKDEAANLPRCLASVQSFVDEMIVVDTGSQDDTIAIAQQWGAQVTSIPWQQDFAAARNHSLTLATSDWIVVLDADETFTPAGQHLLHQVRQGAAVVAESLDTVVAVNLLRHEVNTAQAPYSEVARVFRNRADVRFERPYHESI
ncbi:MAG TPA: glycosyltransferase family 2 protein, partial [Candidatus Obscuribacterales bacterium]